MTTSQLSTHLALAGAISFGISIFAWAALGVFELAPFVIVSTGVAIASAAAGWLLGRRLEITAAAAFIGRTAILAAAISG